MKVRAERSPRRMAESSELFHGVHISCQIGNPIYFTICNETIDPANESELGDEVRCLMCDELNKCPVCGIEVFPEY